GHYAPREAGVEPGRALGDELADRSKEDRRRQNERGGEPVGVEGRDAQIREQRRHGGATPATGAWPATRAARRGRCRSRTKKRTVVAPSTRMIIRPWRNPASDDEIPTGAFITRPPCWSEANRSADGSTPMGELRARSATAIPV